eukprot:CAMPEP_0114112412 /NCGR_PEP_ID=MMETSP0043_2-20121206/2373_1 /TAXON_ID=464988 /ORGANISM="Hemiselmis andersenii, Strain CCMP644" /LENGTH=157 /DNA_ID=CAMNT_0001204509 /DNA_START=73 /DNA_END=547 /DNA_ORIENTATION=-
MIQEISSSGAAEAKRKEMEKKAKAAGQQQQRKGTTDYSKFDHIDSDDEDEEEAERRRSTALPGVQLPKVKKNDARVKAALQDPKVQRVLNTLRTSADDGQITRSQAELCFVFCFCSVGKAPSPAYVCDADRLMAEDDVREKVQLLIAAGVVDIRPPQ